MSHRLNLNTCQPVRYDGPASFDALPVLVDLNWYGAVLTSPNAGIVHPMTHEAVEVVL